MATVRFTLELPEELARDAREFGVLVDEELVELIQAEVDRRVMDFVNEEVHAYRAEKSKRARGETAE
jgi:hypothetical protein